MKDKTKRQFFIMAFIIAMVMSIIENLPVINYQITHEWIKSGLYSFSSFNTIDFIAVYLLTLLSNFMAFFISYLFIKPFNRKRISRRESLWAILIAFVVVYAVYFPLYTYMNHPQGRFYLFNVVRSGMICFMAISYAVAVRSAQLQQMAELENEQLKKENLQTQLEALKNDLSPHFLFNSLNALQALIRENSEVANQYVNHLSNVLRSSLQSNDNRYVRLEEEIKLVQSYIFLVGMRYGTNLIIQMTIDEKYFSFLIPPLTIQTLIENAIKHNEISKRNPLTININTQEDSVIVENNLQPKISPEFSMGIGLNNLTKRFLLLGGKEITISKTDGQFLVTVPLIK
jgi:hypothetical protein